MSSPALEHLPPAPDYQTTMTLLDDPGLAAVARLTAQLSGVSTVERSGTAELNDIALQYARRTCSEPPQSPESFLLQEIAKRALRQGGALLHLTGTGVGLAMFRAYYGELRDMQKNMAVIVYLTND